MKAGIFLSSIVTDFLTLIYNFIPRRQARFGIFDGQIRLRDFNIGPGAGLHKGFAARMLAHMQVGGQGQTTPDAQPVDDVLIVLSKNVIV